MSSLSYLASILISGLSVGLIGILVEVLLLKRLYRSPELFLLMGTFGLILVIQDLSRWLFGSEDLLGPRCPGLDGSIEQFLGSVVALGNQIIQLVLEYEVSSE